MQMCFPRKKDHKVLLAHFFLQKARLVSAGGCEALRLFVREAEAAV